MGVTNFSTAVVNSDIESSYKIFVLFKNTAELLDLELTDYTRVL